MSNVLRNRLALRVRAASSALFHSISGRRRSRGVRRGGFCSPSNDTIHDRHRCRWQRSRCRVGFSEQCPPGSTKPFLQLFGTFRRCACGDPRPDHARSRLLSVRARLPSRPMIGMRSVVSLARRAIFPGVEAVSGEVLIPADHCEFGDASGGSASRPSAIRGQFFGALSKHCRGFRRWSRGCGWCFDLAADPDMLGAHLRRPDAGATGLGPASLASFPSRGRASTSCARDLLQQDHRSGRRQICLARLGTAHGALLPCDDERVYGLGHLFSSPSRRATPSSVLSRQAVRASMAVTHWPRCHFRRSDDLSAGRSLEETVAKGCGRCR